MHLRVEQLNYHLLLTEKGDAAFACVWTVSKVAPEAEDGFGQNSHKVIRMSRYQFFSKENMSSSVLVLADIEYYQYQVLTKLE